MRSEVIGTHLGTMTKETLVSHKEAWEWMSWHWERTSSTASTCIILDHELKHEGVRCQSGCCLIATFAGAIHPVTWFFIYFFAFEPRTTCRCWCVPALKKVKVKSIKKKSQLKSLSYHGSQFLEGIQCLQFQIGAAGRPLQREEAQGWGVCGVS